MVSAAQLSSHLSSNNPRGS
ncbi:hypothetical protein YPPY56_4385, partial [Yersinia pestis PY-56]